MHFQAVYTYIATEKQVNSALNHTPRQKTETGPPLLVRMCCHAVVSGYIASLYHTDLTC